MSYCGPRALPLSTFLGWTRDDQDMALAWAREERAKCSGCGTRLDEWAAADPYEATSYQCRGCALLDNERQAAQDSGDMAGLKFVLTTEIREGD